MSVDHEDHSSDEKMPSLPYLAYLKLAIESFKHSFSKGNLEGGKHSERASGAKKCLDNFLSLTTCMARYLVKDPMCKHLTTIGGGDAVASLCVGCSWDISPWLGMVPVPCCSVLVAGMADRPSRGLQALHPLEAPIWLVHPGGTSLAAGIGTG